METGPRLNVLSDRLVKSGNQPAIPGLQGKCLIHYTTAALIYLEQTDRIGSVGSGSTLIESVLSTEWQCLKNKTDLYKAITLIKCVMLLTLTCRNLSTDYIGRHMAVTPFLFPPLFRKPKNVENPKRLVVRAVVVASSNNFLLTLQDILNPDFRVSYYCGRTIGPKITYKAGTSKNSYNRISERSLD